MQRIMQSDAAVFRTAQTLNDGKRRLGEVFASFKDVNVTDRSLTWNTDLIETLELDNLLGQASRPCIRRRTARRAAGRRRARTFPTAMTRIDEAHPVLGRRPRVDFLRLPSGSHEYADRRR